MGSLNSTEIEQSSLLTECSNLKLFEEFSEEMEHIRATIEQIARDCPMLYDDERLIEDGIRK